MTTVNISEIKKAETETETEDQLTIPFGTYFVGVGWSQESQKDVYILANTGNGVCLISTSDGNRWHDPVYIPYKNCRINAEDFVKVCSDPSVKQLKTVNITYER